MKKERSAEADRPKTELLQQLKHKNRLTALVIVFVLIVMGGAVLLTAAVFLTLNAVGVFRDSGIPMIGIAVIALFSSVVIGVILSAGVSRFFMKPLDELFSVMLRVSEGDFSARVDERGPRHILHKLFHNFNSMVDDLSGIELFRQDFINTFSHEFKTPIISIRGFARQLRDGDPTPEEQREYADIIIAESDRLTDMSSNILLLSKFESQSIVSDKTSFRLDEQIRHCILLFEKEWTEKAIDLEVDLEDVEFTSNEEMLSHVWVNLISNAVKFTPAGGTIALRLEKGGDGVTFTIADSGPGMDAETQKHVFEKFYQGDASHSSQGNGLGLSLVWRIVSLVGGTVSVESEPGSGATFTVFLPYEKEE